MSIEVINVTKEYGEQKALDNVSFSIKQGEIVGLLGPNGAGKSTLMKIITCFIPPTKGDVRVCGFDIFEQSMDVRKQIGYLPEHNPLYLDMYVKEYLGFIAGIYKLGKQTKERVEEMIEITGLTKEYKKKIGQLSKGYRQRVGLAQALIHDPRVLILDEPTSGLDPNQLDEVRHLIRSIGAEKTVILSTHIMQEVEAICSRSIIINNGHIVADEKTENLAKVVFPVSQYVVEFESEIEIGAFKQIDGVKTAKKLAGFTYMLEAEGNTDIRKTVFSWATDRNLTILTIRKEDEKLENIFHRLTKEK